MLGKKGKGSISNPESRVAGNAQGRASEFYKGKTQPVYKGKAKMKSVAGSLVFSNQKKSSASKKKSGGR